MRDPQRYTLLYRVISRCCCLVEGQGYLAAPLVEHRRHTQGECYISRLRRLGSERKRPLHVLMCLIRIPKKPKAIK